MSALAKLCLNKGKVVSGSDKVKTHITEELKHLGATIFYKHQKKNIFGADLVVYTCAVGENNIEVQTARQNGICTIERASFLGKIAKEYEEVIAVAGSHGKTTVCGMISKIFEEFKQKPTLIVGGETSTGNLIIGDKKFLIVEACEYKEHFLKIPHTTGVILNIDFDHPDYFKTEKNYQKAFIKFAKQSKKRVFIDEKHKIIFGDNNVTFGIGGDFSAHHIVYKENSIIFDVYKKN
ncbi:MAG TPA: UDP-N-acetylmuramate--L-alanine ligase, partial [Clostridiales bacterium]|nr:UDP-N-acetylmuramate--L-alanine ligase [Clostridiales bacterium]